MVDEHVDSEAILNEALCRAIARRLSALTLVDHVSVFPAGKPESVIARMDSQYYPAWMDQVTIEVRTYVDGTFHVTHLEKWNGQAWMCRWDRHENLHNSRDHFHQPPDARTADTIDCDHPTDFVKLLESVFKFVDDRLGTIWEEKGRAE